VVVVHVLAIDVGHDGDGRRQHQEGSIALIGFDDHQIARAEVSIRSKCTNDTADDHRRVQTSMAQDCRDHRCRGRLAV